MADVQKENGYTTIANELLEAITGSNLTLRETKIILCVIRYTYGFQRKEAELSLRFISVSTNIDFRHTQTVLTSLISKNILLIKKGNQGITGRIISLNKNYDSWNTLDQIGDTNKPLALTKKVTLALTKTANGSIDQIGDKERQKKTLKKEDSCFFDLIPDELKTIEFKEAWQDWITYKKEKKDKLTASTAKLQFKKLIRFLNEGMNPVDIINQTITEGWTGLFPLKQNGESSRRREQNQGILIL
ncbi:MAG: replication protein [Ignavibacteriaceae bacterium]|jgi:phage replication O-like protein O|nr:replication protein [Ignavibacteriaceae bacterium]